jgi:small-conductance mechanosensitive channel
VTLALRAVGGLVLCMAAALLPLPATQAQTPPASGNVNALPSPVALRATLDAARKQLEAIEAAGDTPGEAPAGTPPSEIAERLALARQRVSLYQQQIEALERLAELTAQRAETQRAMDAWGGFDTPPPRSVLMVDTLRDDLTTADEALAQARERQALFQRVGASFGTRLKAAQAAARQAAEAVEAARGTPALAAAQWQQSLAVLRASVETITAEFLQLAQQVASRELEAAAAAADFARRKLQAAGTQFVLPRSDLGLMLDDIEQRRRRAEADLIRNNAAAAAAGDALASARRMVNSLRDGGDNASSALREAELAVAARQEAATTAQLRVNLGRERLVQLDGEKALWEARAVALGLTDPVRLRAAYERLTESLARIDATTQYLQAQLGAVTARLRDEESRHAGSGSAAARQLLEALRQREADLREARDYSLRRERLVLRFRADLEQRRDTTWTDRLRDGGAAGWLWLKRVWNFELVALEDTLTTDDGRKLGVTRSITVGKTFGAALIVLLGYALVSLIVRRLERWTVKAGRANAQTATLVRKWILFVAGGVLLLVGLLGASIPLTAFAFLGGALAIAAGFGLQNLLKNLVSGVMLLVERPMRLGDLVEVDGIRGRVTEIGIRASTIRSADGIESMIPNSRFVEGNLTNWTLSSVTTRQAISIGVAYGSPLRTVSEILAEVLQRHGHVLKEPAPQVYLDEYGDSSINFGLAYWVEMTQQNDVRRVKSDLLMMIDRAFEEAGIEIPFPQRDVHLTTSAPMPVQVVTSPPQAG